MIGNTFSSLTRHRLGVLWVVIALASGIGFLIGQIYATNVFDQPTIDTSPSIETPLLSEEVATDVGEVESGGFIEIAPPLPRIDHVIDQN